MNSAGFSGFVAVDRAADPGEFLRFLDFADSLEHFRDARQRSLALLDVREGSHLLDVGCGTGTVSRMLAPMVGAEGRVVGIDSSSFLIETARERAAAAGLALEFQVGDAQQLPFPDNTFDGARAERVFMYLEDPRAALTELIRVVRPGGRIAVFDPDMEAWMIDAPDRSLTRRLMNFWCDSVRNGWIGRQWPGMLRASGLDQITVVPLILLLTEFDLVSEFYMLRRTVQRAWECGIVSESEGVGWLEELQDASRVGRFFFAATNMLVAGRKPDVSPGI